MRRVLVVVMALGSSGCGDWVVDADGFTEADLALIQLMVLPAEAPPDPTNRFASDPRAALLGQKLFFDSMLSSPTVVTCADCHAARDWFIDTKTLPNNLSRGLLPPKGGGLAVSGLTKRNSSTLLNVASYRWWGWDGRSDSLWMQCAIAYERTMGGDSLRLAQALSTRYSAEVLSLVPFLPPVPPVASTSDGLVRVWAAIGYKAMAAYLGRLTTPDAPFDAFAAGDREALSADARAGLKLFLGKAGCIECHNGPAFNGASSARSDRDYFRSVGIGQRGLNVEPIDQGRTDGISVLLGTAFGWLTSASSENDALGSTLSVNRLQNLKATPEDLGTFRIKGLRNVAKTGPYMHAGQLATLEEVIDFYDRGGDSAGYVGTRDRRLQPLGLTDAEKGQLVAFLQSLTGRPPPDELLCDNSAAPAPGSTLCTGAR